MHVPRCQNHNDAFRQGPLFKSELVQILAIGGGAFLPDVGNPQSLKSSDLKFALPTSSFHQSKAAALHGPRIGEL